MRFVAEILFRREPGKQFDKRHNTSIRLVAIGHTPPIITLLRSRIQIPAATPALSCCSVAAHRPRYVTVICSRLCPSSAEITARAFLSSAR